MRVRVTLRLLLGTLLVGGLPAAGASRVRRMKMSETRRKQDAPRGGGAIQAALPQTLAPRGASDYEPASSGDDASLREEERQEQARDLLALPELWKHKWFREKKKKSYKAHQNMFLNDDFYNAPRTPKPTYRRTPKPTPKPTPHPTPKPTPHPTPKPTRSPSTAGKGPGKGPGGFPPGLPNPPSLPTPTPPSPSPPTPTQPIPTPPTQPTNECRSRDRTAVLLEVLSPVTDTGLLTGGDSTPQGQAFEWLDGMDTSTDPCTYATLTQRYSLAVFFYATGGAGWTTRTGWLSPAAECSWYNVDCDNEDLVSGIRLLENGLAGSLPSELSVFRSSLNELALANNTLTGNFPASFSTLSSLVELDVEANSLSGNPWPRLLPLSNLAMLRISTNDFTGTVPAEVGDWDRLVEFWIAENRFSGALPTQLGDLGNLQSLFLYSNDFSGRIPSELGQLSLFGFQAHDNQLTGEIPNEFYNNVDLLFLRLDNNRLSGPISGEFGQLVNLSDLWLTNNSFTGDLPFSFYGLKHLENVLLRNNSFTGSLRDSFTLWDDLEFFDLAFNSFDGLLPPSLFDVPTLRIVYLFDNSFQGALPTNYGNPPALRDLWLHNNELNGPIPVIGAGQLLQLSEFLLQGNEFTGPMPASVCSLRTNGVLDDLFADCNPPEDPEVICSRTCCNMCFP